MKTRPLGSSGLDVPLLCLGSMTWGQQNSQDEAFEQLDYALEVSGGTLFVDTAEMYPVPPQEETVGRTEVIIGNWLAARKNREKIILATKVTGPGFPRNFVVGKREVPPNPNPTPAKLDEANIRAALTASLRRLQTDYVDLYQLHWPSRYVPLFGKRQYKQADEVKDRASFEEQVTTLGALIKEGKIRHWGLSNETTFGVCQMCETAKRLGVPPPVSIQNDFSLVFRHFEEELAEACSPSNYNVGLLTYGALAGGTLSGKYLGGQKPAKARHTLFPGFQPRYIADRTSAATEKYAAIAAAKGLTPSTLALAWAAGRSFQTSVIVGATTLEQLKENIAALDVELDEDTLKQIDAVHVEMRNPNALD